MPFNWNVYLFCTMKSENSRNCSPAGQTHLLYFLCVDIFKTSFTWCGGGILTENHTFAPQKKCHVIYITSKMWTFYLSSRWISYRHTNKYHFCCYFTVFCQITWFFVSLLKCISQSPQQSSEKKQLVISIVLTMFVYCSLWNSFFQQNHKRNSDSIHKVCKNSISKM